jgi:spermidine synthase
VLSREPAAPVPPDDSSIGSSRPTRSSSHFGLLLLCFFLSGLAALIYQTAWMRNFAFVFGTSELAVASVLAAYMGGLALGAAVVSRLAPRVRRPVLVYGVLELLIGLAALGVPSGIRIATHLYVAIFGSQNAPADEGGLLSALFYLACSFAILLVPTSLMGATLPLLARHAVRREEEIGRRIAQLYAMNTAGAVAGTVLTGFFLLPTLGLAATVWVAVAANGVVFAAAAALARRAPSIDPTPPGSGEPDPRDPNRWILVLIAISGAVSFTYEVLWTRLLAHVLGGSVYAFATMLATFLTGIAIGSWLASGRLASDRRSAAAGFAWAQVGAGILSLAAYLAIDSTPSWIAQMRADGDLALLIDVVVCAGILLPGTLFIGATFPLAVRVLARRQEEAGQASARVYAWNTVGAITGAVGAGFFLIPSVGFALTLTLAVAVNAGLAAAACWLARPRLRAALAGGVACLVLLAIIRPEPPWQVLRTGPITSRIKTEEIVYFGVGRGATVLLQVHGGGWQVSSNGLPEATINRAGVRVGRFVMVRWLSNLPAWGRPQARSMLIVGFGGGLAVEAVPPNFETVDVVEIEPRILEANRRIASERREDPLADPRVNVIVNDARSALLLTKERYDAIVSQPSHPWTAAASHLYTREFFEIVRDHLSDDGVFVQWMGLGFIDEPLLRSLVATLQEVFPHVRLYRPSSGGLLFTASPEPFEPEQRIGEALADSPILAAELGIHGGADLAAHLVLDEAGARALAKGARVSTDDRNLLQMNSPGVTRRGRRLDPAALLAPLDPLRNADLPWSRAYLVRRAIAAGLDARAERIVQATPDPAERRVGQGFLARLRGDRAEAIGHFRAALDQAPTNREARVALMQLARAGGTATDAWDELLGDVPDPRDVLLLTAWKEVSAGNFEALAELDGRLAEIGPHDPAFVPASRLRTRLRLRDGTPERVAEALVLMDTLLPLGGSLGDLLLRAHAAAAAGYPHGAAASIEELVRKATPQPSHAAVLARGLALLNGLPDESISESWRDAIGSQLRRKLRRAKQ